jgi:hypothetical protein
MWKGVNGDSYIGEWKDSRADGYGVHVWSNGDRYEGEWKGCLKHGHGTDIFANDDVYVGEYSNGKPEGNGQYTWANGSYYVGEFRSGLKHGKGKWRRSKDNHSDQYEGEYKNDKKNGFGEFTWASGNTYKGAYKSDEREGFGVMRWTDGSTYEGDWVRGIQHGKGKMTFPDGTIKQGIFDNVVFKGEDPGILNGKKSPKNKGPLKALSSISEKKAKKQGTSARNVNKKKTSSRGLNNTGKINKHVFIRQNSSSSNGRMSKNQLNNSNPSVGLLNGNGTHATLPVGVIQKPGKGRKNVSDANSSFDDNNSNSPYANPDKDYMLN